MKRAKCCTLLYTLPRTKFKMNAATNVDMENKGVFEDIRKSTIIGKIDKSDTFKRFIKDTFLRYFPYTDNFTIKKT